MIIIGGHHQGQDFDIDQICKHPGQDWQLLTALPADAKLYPFDPEKNHWDDGFVVYQSRQFKTGNPKDNILYLAPIEWDNKRCFLHLLSMVKK
jgi:hypothetical protein